MSFSSSIPGCLTWSFFRAQLVLPSITLRLRLEFCGCNLNMYFNCWQGFMTSGPLILVRLSCCNLLQPVISVLLSHLLLLLLQKFLFLLNSLLHSSLVSYSIFLHIMTFKLITLALLNKFVQRTMGRIHITISMLGATKEIHQLLTNHSQRVN